LSQSSPPQSPQPASDGGARTLLAGSRRFGGQAHRTQDLLNHRLGSYERDQVQIAVASSALDVDR